MCLSVGSVSIPLQTVCLVFPSMFDLQFQLFEIFFLMQFHEVFTVTKTNALTV